MDCRCLKRSGSAPELGKSQYPGARARGSIRRDVLQPPAAEVSPLRGWNRHVGLGSGGFRAWLLTAAASAATDAHTTSLPRTKLSSLLLAIVGGISPTVVHKPTPYRYLGSSTAEFLHIRNHTPKNPNNIVYIDFLVKDWA